MLLLSHFHPSVHTAHTVQGTATPLQLLLSLLSGHSPSLDEESQDLDKSATFEKVRNAHCGYKALMRKKLPKRFIEVSLPVEIKGFKDCCFLWVLTVLVTLLWKEPFYHHLFSEEPSKESFTLGIIAPLCVWCMWHCWKLCSLHLVHDLQVLGWARWLHCSEVPPAWMDLLRTHSAYVPTLHFN